MRTALHTFAVLALLAARFALMQAAANHAFLLTLLCLPESAYALVAVSSTMLLSNALSPAQAATTVMLRAINVCPALAEMALAALAPLPALALNVPVHYF
jgi:hypothetical protein